MLHLVLGIAAACAASTLYSVGIAIQALDARDVHSEHSLHPRLFSVLMRRGRWMFGTSLTIAGWPLQVLALSLAPLVVVQPSLAVGLFALLLVGQRMLGEHAGQREWAAVGAILAGVVVIAVLAPRHTTGHAHHGVVAAVLLILAIACTAPYVLARLGLNIPVVTIVGAGLGFGWSALSTKLLANAIQNDRWGAAATWAVATALASLVALLTEMSALQERPAVRVAPVVFVVQTVTPIALSPLLFRENFLNTPLDGAPLLASLAVLCAGAVVLARSPLLLAVTSSDPAAAANTS